MSLIPAWCFNCHRYLNRSIQSPVGSLCRDCLHALPVIEGPTCDHCGLEHSSDSCSENWAVEIERFYSLFYYRDPIHRWIVNHKYSSGFFAGRVLRSFVGGWFEDNAGWITGLDAVVPVPIHPLRLRQRGFNQTTFLLRGQRQLPVRTDWLAKRRHTSQQAGLSGAQRERNIRGAFSASASVAHRHLLIFDDVCTTGGTLGEICLALLERDVGSIHVLTLSRSM